MGYEALLGGREELDEAFVDLDAVDGRDAKPRQIRDELQNLGAEIAETGRSGKIGT